jgi:hypothetical protein
VNGYVTKPVTVTYDDCTALIYKYGTLIGGYENGTELAKDGTYEIVVTDIAGNVTTVTFTLVTIPPTVELIGVEGGGTVKGGTVILRDLSETATVEVYFNGSLIPYTLGESLSDLGSYRIVLTDAAGNVIEYSFEIAYAVNTAGTVIILIVILGIIGSGVAVFLFRKRGKFRPKK